MVQATRANARFTDWLFWIEHRRCRSARCRGRVTARCRRDSFRGGRPDLAGEALPKVQAPTLLIVGGNDDVVIELNEQARDQMRCKVKLEIVPGATHLFEEPGALEQVAKLASDWFVYHIGAKQAP